MADVKVSGMPADASPTLDDLVMIVDTTNGENRRVTLSDLADLISNNLTDESVQADDIDFDSGLIWKEIGRHTLGSAADTLTVDNLPSYRFLMIKTVMLATGGTVNPSLRFNNDSGSNYAGRYSDDGAADITSVSQSSALFRAGTVSVPQHGLGWLTNLASSEKILRFECTEQATAGAANAPGRLEGVQKWVNTSVVISRVDLVNSSTGDFATGSELIVYGAN